MSKKLLCLAVCISAFTISTGTASAAIPPAERNALIALFNNTGGDTWSDKSGWKDTGGNFTASGDEGNWYGVTVENDTVVDIDLYYNNLVGTIPTELGSLSGLTSLELSSNYLSGPIPTALGSLANLVMLDLEWNELSGPIPTVLANLANLENLDLSWNRLTGAIPAQLGGLSKLIELGLIGNLLTDTIPTALGNLSNLESLNLDMNQLSGPIPAELGGIASLQQISMWKNQLTGGIPAALGNLTNLTYLDLSENQLDGIIPPAVGNLTNMWYLSLADNNLTGVIPSEVGSLLSLNSLDLGNNRLNGDLPAQLINLTNLSADWSDICGNYLFTDNGTLRDFLNSKQTGGDWESCQLTTVAHDQYLSTPEDTDLPLTLTATDMKGETLTYQVLTNPSHGTLSGTAPDLTYSPAAAYSGPDSFTFNVTGGTADSNTATVRITVMNSLADQRDVLVLLYNSTTGGGWSNSTGWLGDEASLASGDWYGVTVIDNVVVYVDLAENNLVGTLPTELSNLPGLQELRLHGNNLTGGIPDSLGSLSNLTMLRLYDNNLTGGIPSTLGSLSKLEYLYVSRNNLDGPVPVELGSLSKLRAFTGENNGFTGGIPPELGNLALMYNLDLSGNQLSGGIPAAMGSLASLNYLDIAGNMLSGSVPTELLGLTTLYDGDSDFCGNHLYTSNGPLNTFLNSKQDPTASGGDWASCQQTTARDQEVTTAVNTPVGIVLQATDAQQDPLTYTVVTDPAHGTLIGTAPNLTYTPALDYMGPDSFTFKANDGTADSNEATVSILVSDVVEEVKRSLTSILMLLFD